MTNFRITFIGRLTFFRTFMKRSSVKFDISVYTIEFKSIFLYKDIQEQFVEFLETANELMIIVIKVAN